MGHHTKVQNPAHKKHGKVPIYEITKRKHICNIYEALFFIFGYFVYISFFIPIMYAVLQIPDVDTGNYWFKKLLSRDNHFTTYFSPGKFLLWMCMVISGFAFVNIFNLMNQRRSFFRGRDGTYRDFFVLTIVSIFLYFTSPIIALRSKHDMQRDLYFGFRWENNLPHENVDPQCKGNMACVDPYPVLPPLPQTIRFLIREFALFFYQLGFPVGANCCYVYTDREVMMHNFWVIAFFCLGMNYTHLDFPPFSQFSFNTKQLRNYNWFGWTLFTTFFIGVFANIYYIYHVHMFTMSHTLYLYVTAIIILFVIAKTVLLRKTHYVHIHHYSCGMLGMIYWGFQNIYVASLCGLMAGVMVEGAARWGFADTWKIKAVIPPKIKTK